MRELRLGQTIATRGSKSARVLGQLGEGGQGIVYKVDYAGKPMALKWYFKSKLKNPERFYENIKSNIEHRRPTDAFLWPVDVTEWVGGTFGYIMPLKPPEYGDFSKYLLAKENFSSVRALINAALNIVEGFAALHRKGYNYQDLNDGNFFVNFATGDVLICDNDNVMGHGYNSGIKGKCRYMAPEVVTGKMPDKQTDRFSLAVVLFLLLFGNHPLEGKATNPPCMTEELEMKYYGTDPVFIFDPVNKGNIPILGIHRSVIAKWPLYPQYVRDAFKINFGYEQLHAQKPRFMEKEWLDMFVRLRSETIKCGCGRELFVNPAGGAQCKCGKQINIPAHLKFKKMNVPIYPGVNLYACHTADGSEDFRAATAEVIVSKNNPGNLGLKNLSNAAWYATGQDGRQIPVNKNEVVRIAGQLAVNFGNNMAAEIVKN